MFSGWRRLGIRNPKPTIPGRFGDWRTHTGSSITVGLVRTRSSISAWPSNSPHHVTKSRTDSVFAPSFLVLRTELDNADAIGYALYQVLSASHVKKKKKQTHQKTKKKTREVSDELATTYVFS